MLKKLTGVLTVLAVLTACVTVQAAGGSGERRRPAERDTRRVETRAAVAAERPHWSDRGQHVPKFNEVANPPKVEPVKTDTRKADPPPTPRPHPPTFKY